MVSSQNPTPKVNDPKKAIRKAPPALVKYARLVALQKKIELPMLVLSFLWLCVLIAEMVLESNQSLHHIGTGLWLVFGVYFLMRLLIVANRTIFLKKNWLFVVAISVSILRFFPILERFPLVRAITATFGMQVIWIFASADQSMRSIRRNLGRRGVGYALAFTAVIMIAGSAGMLHFEQISEESDRIQSYSRALWWTAMQMTNIGSAYSVKTQGGQIICLIISIYAAGMFGYLTALFASFIIDREIKDPKIELARQKQLSDMQRDIATMTHALEDLTNTSASKKSSNATPIMGKNSQELG